MTKLLILLFLSFGLAGCGNSSKIKNDTAVNSLGDGTHITLPFVVPLSDESASYKSPLGQINPLVRGLVGSIMNIGASIGAGNQRLTMTQPIPEIPESYIGSIKIKRIFFYMEDELVVEDPEKKPLISLKFLNFSKGRADFDFLRRLAVKISSTKMNRAGDSWDPEIETKTMDGEEMSSFNRLFPSKREKQAKDWDDNSTGLLMFRYDQQKKEESLIKESGTILVIETEHPNLTRKYLETTYGDYLKRVHILRNSVLVELKKDPVVEEMFKMRLAADSAMVDELKIGQISPCNIDICLDLKVPDVNLIPLLKKGNAIKIDAFIDPKETPKSFKLKGFIEFEVKVKSVL